VTSGLKEDGAIIINSENTPQELKKRLRGYNGKICTIAAGKIAEETLGQNIPNIPMLAAAVKVSGVISEEQFVKDMEESLKHKFADKPHVIDGNMKAIEKSLKEVQIG
jgi:pyruvate ferredoxin oxidoreductase gamma subunit